MQADALNDPIVRKVEGLGKILEETMNAVIKLSESLTIQLMEMDARLRAVEAGGGQVTRLKGPPPTAESTPQSAQPNVRSNVLGELRDLFAKKKKLDL